VIRTKAGHVLLFDDTTNKEKIRLVTRAGHEFEMHDKDKEGKQFLSLRSRKGHRLLFEDEDGKEKLEASSQGGHTVSIDDAGRAITIRTSGGQTIVMDAGSGSVTLSGVTITLDATATLSLDAPSIEIGGVPTDRVVLGDQLMDLFNKHTHPIPGGSTGKPSTPMTGKQLSVLARVR
jgi:hypothetical protein